VTDALSYPALSARFAASPGSPEPRRTYRRVLFAAGPATFLTSGAVSHSPGGTSPGAWCADRFFDFATDWGPCPPHRPRRTTPSPPRPERGPLSAHELLWLIDAAELVDQPICALVLMLAVNGIGVQEALSVDVERLTTSRGSAVARLPRRRGRRSVIPLCRPVRAAIHTARAGRSGGPLLTATTGTEQLGLIEAGQRLTAAAAGITSPVTPEVLEQTFVPLAVTAGPRGRAASRRR
jgi:integrase